MNIRHTSILLISLTVFGFAAEASTQSNTHGDHVATNGLATAKEARITWNESGRSSADSMPLGNGDIALNVWTEPDGQIAFYVAKSDAWDAFGQLIKVGLVRMRFSPNPFENGVSLEFRPDEACVVIGSHDRAFTAKVRVDANHPLVLVEATGNAPVDLEVRLDPWRKQARRNVAAEAPPGIGPRAAPDHVSDRWPDRLVWYQRNETSVWKPVLDFQKLGAFTEGRKDPLLHRTFGGALAAEGLSGRTGDRLVSKNKRHTWDVSLSVLTSQPANAGIWESEANALLDTAFALDRSALREAHQTWWAGFWNRSWIRLQGFPEAKTINDSYVWQRFLLGASGRGAYPIKFNGGLFTADWVLPERNPPPKNPEPVDADYRRWAGAYWFQNTRLMYWALLGAGDYSEMLPLFDMYREQLPLAEFRSREWYGHAGAGFFETAHFFGALRTNDFGRDRTGLGPTEVKSQYIGKYWSSGLELSLMMAQYHRATRDSRFLEDTLLPVADAVLRFYDNHYPTVSGRLHIAPSQALEQFHEVENPMDVVAGMRAVLQALLKLDSPAIAADRRAYWKTLLDKLPPLPISGEGAKARLVSAQVVNDPKPRNSENPELYAIFPYALYGVGHPDLDLARRTFEARRVKRNGGWRQDSIQAASVGLAEDAATGVKAIAAHSFGGARFAAFRGPNFDWIPDMGHASVIMIALQKMILQAHDGSASLMPAWPEGWEADFRLPLPDGTPLEGRIAGGKVGYHLPPGTGWQIKLPRDHAE